MPLPSNFLYLKDEWPLLFEPASRAESIAVSDLAERLFLCAAGVGIVGSLGFISTTAR